MENGEWRMENGEWRMENGQLIVLVLFNSEDFFSNGAIANNVFPKRQFITTNNFGATYNMYFPIQTAFYVTVI